MSWGDPPQLLLCHALGPSETTALLRGSSLTSLVSPGAAGLGYMCTPPRPHPFLSLNPTHVCEWALALAALHPTEHSPIPRRWPRVPLVAELMPHVGTHRSWSCIPPSTSCLSLSWSQPRAVAGVAQPLSVCPLCCVGRPPRGLHTRAAGGLLLMPQPWTAGPPVPVRSPACLPTLLRAPVRALLSVP